MKSLQFALALALLPAGSFAKKIPAPDRVQIKPALRLS
jgi:hypothetical protein